MINFLNADQNLSYQQRVKNYYRFHAPIYDATRWSFLFGRHSIIEMIPELPSRPRIMEVGCGTGTNMKLLKNRFPDARITGLDFSDKMLSVAKNKIGNNSNVSFKKHCYGSDSLKEDPFDLILLSYSLTMIDIETETILKQLRSDLKPKAYIAIVDFHTSPFYWFRRWMEMNHADFSGNSLSLLQQHFETINCDLHPAYFGLWNYYQFLGKTN